MITGFYAGILGFLFVWLSLEVIKLRKKNKVGYGDGQIEALQYVIAAQNNAAQYIPITLFLLFFLEYQHIYSAIIHIAAITFILGRIIHAFAMKEGSFKKRVLGMQLTLWTIISLAALNLLWPIYLFFKV